jgi:hypothetical protein
MPETDHDSTGASRRAFLTRGVVGGFALLAAGCSGGRRNLPDPIWSPRNPSRNSAAGVGLDPDTSGLIHRARWASGPPVPAMMTPMAPITYVTVHHDGMTPFYGDTAEAAMDRLERIRLSHRGKKWGDIGYHYAVDRGGRVWECRPISWQGAHVKDHNAGNIGVVALGNFDEQTPTEAQVNAVRSHVSTLMSTYRVQEARVRTHREWAPTACPGAHLQQRINAIRMQGAWA